MITCLYILVVCYYSLSIDFMQHVILLYSIKKAFALGKQFSDDSVWRRLYYNAGGVLATTLDYLSRIDEAEAVFKVIMELEPTGFYTGDFALFAQRRLKDNEKAQANYIKALQAFPNQSSIHLKYAGFLRNVLKDQKKAAKHYTLACDANPNNAEALGGFASFLHGVVGDTVAAGEYYEKAFQVDHTHTNNLCNYGLFLSEIKKNYKRAEEVFKIAIASNSMHGNTLYNYAVMLDTHVKRKDEAEEVYKKCIAAEPKHAFALYNVAVLMEESYLSNKPLDTSKGGGGAAAAPMDKPTRNAYLQEVGTFYRRAMEADPNDVTALADYGRFTLMKAEDAGIAEPVLLKALKLNPKSENALFHLGIIFHRNRENLSAAETIFRNVLRLNKKHPASLLQLGRVLVDIFTKWSGGLFTAVSPVVIGTTQLDPIKSSGTKPNPEKNEIREVLDEGFTWYEMAIEHHKDPTVAMTEYSKLVALHGNAMQKMRAVKQLEAAFKRFDKDGSVRSNRNAEAIVQFLQANSKKKKDDNNKEVVKDKEKEKEDRGK